ncbi:hypothetical protein LDENG_00084200 [Lucifuga dentata]|nr:hypothetical protein LDENG_00084200 [Lucifuga dentata]
MLKVSSTEPRTLRNCDPPHSTDEQKPPAQTIPLRPSPHLPGPGGLSHISAAATAAAPPLLIITSAPAVGAAKTLQAPAQVFRVPGPAATSTSQPDPSFCQPAATQTLTLPPAGLLQPASLSVSPASSKQAQPLPLMTVHIATAANTESVGAPAIQVTPRPLNVVRGHPVSVSRPQQHAHPATRASSSSSSSQHPLKTEMPSVSIISSSVHNTHSSSASGLTPIPSFTPSSSSSSSSSSQAGYGQTSKRDSPRTCGVRSVVDFEKIYHYLSVVHEPNTAFALTPTESAVVLDLLMSLQEELPLLDCNKLQRHFAQVYRCLSSSANSSMAEQMFKDLQAAKEGSDKHEFHAESHQTPRSRDQVTGPEPNRDRTGPEPDQDGTGPEPDLSKTRVKTMSERSVSSGESDRKAAVGCEGKTRDEKAESQSAERLFAPLNPFMVPLKLLMRR